MNDKPNQTKQNVFAATSVAEIHAAIAALDVQQFTVAQRLQNLHASRTELSREISKLDLLRASIGTEVVHSRLINNGMLSGAVLTANCISTSVKRVDQEQSNVKATLEIVEQVAELKSCILGIHGSMGALQDWEAAAGYLDRAYKVPSDVIDSSFAEDIVPTTEIPDTPRVTLEGAAESLCGLFSREFDKATQQGDSSGVTRFFKLFPLIRRSDVGLDTYGRYVCQGVASRARTNLSLTSQQSGGHYFHASAITKLFEHIAQIVDGHEPLVERHYGSGMMIKVINRLQLEADTQGGIILDTWHDDRTIDRHLTDIKSYAFSFLVQSFLTSQRPTAGTPRSQSPAHPAERTSEDEGVRMKEIDGLLSESALMLRRWALYSRFISSKCSSHTPGNNTDDDLIMPHFLSSSNLHKRVQTHLVEPFTVMTTFFFRRSVEKALQADQFPLGLNLNTTKPLGADSPFITTAVDTVMYILNQMIQRSLATSQRAVVSNVLPAIGRILGSDFIVMIQRKMLSVDLQTASSQGFLPSENKAVEFLVLMNNLDVANEYIKRIVEQQLGSQPQSSGNATQSPLEDLFYFDNDARIVESSLRCMERTFVIKSSQLLSDSIQVAFYNILKPRIRPVLTDTFRDINYRPTGEPDDDNDACNDADLVALRFDRGWSALIRPIKRILTPTNFERLLSITLPYLAAMLQRRIKGYHTLVNELGAVKLQRDISGIVTVAVTGGKYRLRDYFAKCTQMTLVMNMEEDEWEDLNKDETEKSDIAWVLAPDERIFARSIVTRLSQ